GPAQGQLLAASVSADTPLRIRQVLQSWVADHDGPLTLTAAEWLALGADPLVFHLRLRSVRKAGQLLRQQDGDLLDTMLQRVATAPVAARDEFGAALCRGLEFNPSP